MTVGLRIAFLSICATSLAAGAPVVLAQSSVAGTSAPVEIDGRAIFHVRGIKGASPELRARAISERIIRFASDPYFSTAAITVDETDISSDIVASDNILTSVFDLDVEAAGTSRQEMAAQYAQVLRSAIDQYRHDHSSKNILKGSLFALLSTLALVLILFVLHKAYRKLQSLLPLWAHTKLLPASIKKYHIVGPDQISSVILGAVRFVRLAAVLVLLYFYAGMVFSFFPLTRGFSGQLLDFAIGPLKTMWQGLRAQAPNLFFIWILVLITRYVLKLTQAFFRGIESGAFEIAGFDRDWVGPTSKLVRILLIAFAVTISYPYIPGSGSDAFKGVSIFLGILISFGSSSLVSNVVAGLTMTYMRAFKVGDRVKIHDYTGDVIATGLQVTHIKTPKNEIISVPNSTITSSHVINYSALARKQGLILHTTVGIGYEAPWRQVRAMLLMAAEKTPGVLRQPQPFVFQQSLGDFCVTYELNAYTDRPNEMATTYSNLHKNILDSFNEYGVQIMTPAYEGDRDVPAIVPKENWYAAPADRFSDAEAETQDQKEGTGRTPD